MAKDEITVFFSCSQVKSERITHELAAFRAAAMRQLVNSEAHLDKTITSSSRDEAPGTLVADTGRSRVVKDSSRVPEDTLIVVIAPL